jgi:RNA polymerase sigma factor (sigma-70 family)
MYEPASKFDYDKINALDNYFKKIYRIIIGVVLLISGICFAFLPSLIEGEIPSGVNIYVVFSIYLLDVIPDNTENFDLTVQKNIDVSSMLKFMDVLSLREKNIIIKRYGLYGSDVYTQKDIARIMGISRSYVSRLEKRALIKLYKEFYRHNKKDL